MEYPYLPEGREIFHVGEDDPNMQEAKKMWAKSTCTKQRTGAVVVRDGEVIGRANNTVKNAPDECPRDKEGFKTGEGYHLCKDVCEQVQGHSEANAVKNAQTESRETEGGDIYLYGHWWCCKGCWDEMIKGGIRHVYLLDEADMETDWDKKYEEYSRDSERDS
ncbi:hypothetical protein C4544_02980 [candidate division WS5 bacterium]|uniref:CMP/dCMP-type deaminase domain-containing protein n=1 Tax=candidate division WS5 bacterium TaxID=2093353 RepID=A0A419DEE8_9BACT|nr:MAG: hypothetical protein C4544_02980 [candidate division WS5 bacterium]